MTTKSVFVRPARLLPWGACGLLCLLLAIATSAGEAVSAEDKAPKGKPAAKEQVASLPGIKLAVDVVTERPQAGRPLQLQITVTNPGKVDRKNVDVNAGFGGNLEHKSKASNLKMKLGTLIGGESRVIPLIVTPKEAGQTGMLVQATVPDGPEERVAVSVFVSPLTRVKKPGAAGGTKNPAKEEEDNNPKGALRESPIVPLEQQLPETTGFEFKIDPKTPLDDLLPIPPKYRHSARPMLSDDLAKVPEIAFQEPFAKDNPEKTSKQTAHALAKINHLNGKKTDAFMEALVSKRTDLAGLPFVMGDACRMNGKRSGHFGQALASIRLALSPPPRANLKRPIEGAAAIPTIHDTMALLTVAAQTQDVQGGFVQQIPPFPTDRDGAESYWLQYEFGKEPDKANLRITDSEQDDAMHARVAALMQVMAPQSSYLRQGLAKYLAKVSHPEATRALAKLAIFSAEEEVRKPAIDALKVRRERDYTAILLAGLRYPFPPVARRAADALVKLERKDLIPQLVDFLEEADPRLPVVNKDKVPTVRELVRINHHRNCMLCHAPARADDGPPDEVVAPVPIPGEPLPSFSQGYQSGTPDIAVRVDVTYLRQDFSVLQPVANAHPWPEMQRFDFLVHTRRLTEDEARSYRELLTPREEGVLSPYQRAALAALRELTGRDTAPTPESWRQLLDIKKK